MSVARPGDELIGLTRAVLYAGAPSMVVSLWEVDDLSTALLMADFYARVRDGGELAESLRGAQLALARMPASDVVAHCDRRLAAEHDPVTRAALLLDRAGAYAVAGDLRRAIETCGHVAPGLVGVLGTVAVRLRARAARQLNLMILKAEAATSIDYTARPFEHPYYWAPFMLVGDWR